MPGRCDGWVNWKCSALGWQGIYWCIRNGMDGIYANITRVAGLGRAGPGVQKLYWGGPHGPLCILTENEGAMVMMMMAVADGGSGWRERRGGGSTWRVFGTNRTERERHWVHYECILFASGEALWFVRFYLLKHARLPLHNENNTRRWCRVHKHFRLAQRILSIKFVALVDVC